MLWHNMLLAGCIFWTLSCRRPYSVHNHNYFLFNEQILVETKLSHFWNHIQVNYMSVSLVQEENGFQSSFLLTKIVFWACYTESGFYYTPKTWQRVRMAGWMGGQAACGGRAGEKLFFCAKDREDNELSTETDERGVFNSSKSLSDGPKTGISDSVRQVVFVVLLLSEKRSNNSYRRYFFSFIVTSSVNEKVKTKVKTIW